MLTYGAKTNGLTNALQRPRGLPLTPRWGKALDNAWYKIDEETNVSLLDSGSAFKSGWIQPGLLSL